MAKTILVTGAAGYIGSHTCVELINSGFNVIGLDNFDNSSMATIYKIEAITRTTMQFITSNCVDGKLPKDIDGIIHFAAHKSVGESVQNPTKYFSNNIGSLNAILDHAKVLKVPVVFSSSACVYGDQYRELLHEDLELNPINPYGLTKVFGESMLKAADAAYGIPTAALRYFNPIGSHESGLLGDTTITNLMPYILKVATKEAPFLEVFGNDYNTPDGTAIRDYIHVTDIAKAHIKAIQHLIDTGKSLPPINIGNGEGLSVLQIVEAFEVATMLEIPYEFRPRRSGDAPTLVASNKRYRSLLSQDTHKSVEAMCRSALNFKLKGI